MARPRKSATLCVYLNARLVGFLRKASSGAISFEYSEDWIDWENTFPVSLSLPLRKQKFIGEAVTAVFDNLLPDNDDIRGRIASMLGAKGSGFFELLAGIGRDCVGALQFLPEEIPLQKAGEIKGRELSEKEVADKISHLPTTPLGLTAEDPEFRISIAGAQEKTAFLYHEGKWWEPHGTTPTTHILKPQIGKRSDMDLSMSVENEHLCMTFCSKIGLPVARTDVVDFCDLRVLSIERFDRKWTRDGKLLRLPQEDFCQSMSVPPSLKYENQGGPGIKRCMDHLKASDSPSEDRNTFFKALIVYWLLGATDGHAKNFSIFLKPGGGFRMTPLYDILSTQPNRDDGDISLNKMKMAMALLGKNRHYTVDTILRRHFENTARICGFPQTDLEGIFHELKDKALPGMRKALEAMPDDFPESLGASVLNGVKTRLDRL